MKDDWFPYVVAGIVGLVLITGVLIVIAAAPDAPEPLPEPVPRQAIDVSKLESANHLYKIARAAKVERAAFGDHYPSALEDLAKYLKRDLFLHPTRAAAAKADKFVSDYESLFDRASYRLPRDVVPSTMPLAWERREFHKGGRNVVFFGDRESDDPPRAVYRSMCVVRATRAAAAVLCGKASLGDLPANFKAGVLDRYRSMVALRGSDVLREVEEQTEAKPVLRQNRIDELYQKLGADVQVTSDEPLVLTVTYDHETSEGARDVLRRLVNYFVTHARAHASADARTVRDKARRDWDAAKAALDEAEGKLAKFRKDHPDVVSPSKEPEKGAGKPEKKPEPKPGAAKAPGKKKPPPAEQLARLEQAKAAAAARYAKASEAHTRARLAWERINLGEVPFTVETAAAKPDRPVRSIAAALGDSLTKFVTDAEFRELMERADLFLDEHRPQEE